MWDLKNKKAEQGREEENRNRFVVALRNQDDPEDREVMLSDLSLNKNPELDLLTCNWSAREHWDLQLKKLMTENFMNISALPAELLEKYIIALASKFSSEYHSHQTAVIPLIVFPQNLLPLGIKLKLLKAQASPLPDMLLPTPMDFTRFGSRTGEPASFPYLAVGLEMKKNTGLASKMNSLFLSPINGKKEMTLDEGLMLAFFYGIKYKSILKGTLYFSENREKYWPVLESNPETGAYTLRLSHFRDNEPDAFVPCCHKRFY